MTTRQVAAVEDSLDQSRISWTDVDGIRTRFYEDGEGEPLVLIHGGHFGFIDALDTWSLNLKELAKSFHVYAFDKIGQGYTGIPARDRDYTYDMTLRHAARWIESVGIERAHLVGHSRGGFLAASLAFEIEGLADSLVIVNSATLGPDPADPKIDANLFYTNVWHDVPPGPPTREVLRLEPEANSYSTAHVTEAYIDRYLEIARLPTQVEAAAKMGDGLMENVFMPNLTERRAEVLARVARSGLPARTLVVWSRNDPSASFVEIGLKLWDELCRTMPYIELHVLNEAGHYSYRECPREFNRLVTAFCSDARGDHGV